MTSNSFTKGKKDKDPPILLLVPALYILYLSLYYSPPGYSYINNSLEFDIGIKIYAKLLFYIKTIKNVFLNFSG